MSPVLLTVMPHALLIFATSFTLTYAFIVVLMPLFRLYALSRPNVRSSHIQPTPQGGGLAVILSGMTIFTVFLSLIDLPLAPFLPVLGATVILTFLGAWDDISPLPASLRLVVQIMVTGSVVFLMPPELHLFVDTLPLVVERVLMGLGLAGFLNLVNFVDGLDWVSVAALSPILGVFVILLWPEPAFALAVALLAALLGFAPFNRPVAKLFLGDAGSLPLGFLAGWLLMLVAMRHGLASALLPVFYYLADTGITLFRRLLRGENLMKAHKEHFYQKAVLRGFSVLSVALCLFGLHMALAGLALAVPHIGAFTTLAIGAVITASCLALFAHGRQA
jgi:UDP-N-acetylmuramyl pentapeptide phosphotransferase/UDP-N-acetylglucosamine-1-phosphate transferase